MVSHRHSRGFPRWQRLQYRPVGDKREYWAHLCRFNSDVGQSINQVNDGLRNECAGAPDPALTKEQTNMNSKGHCRMGVKNNEVNKIRALIWLFREDTWRNDYRRSEQLSNDMPLQGGHMNKWLQAFWTIERENHESYDMLKTNDWNAKCIQSERLKYNLWLSKHSLQDPSLGWEGEAWATDPQSSPSRQQDRPKWQ